MRKIAKLRLTLILSCILTACQVVPTASPVPQSPTPMVEPHTTQAPTQAPSQTPLPTLTPHPTLSPTNIPFPTATATPTEEPLAFPIPAAPANAEAEIWEEAFLNAMRTQGIIKLKYEAGQTQPYWDDNLNTVAWIIDGETMAYNREFELTGDLVSDIYGGQWIVRKKLSQHVSATGSVWSFNRLHLPDSNELVMGTQCVPFEFGAMCGLVGQVVAVETVDLRPYLLPAYAESGLMDKNEIFQGLPEFQVSVVRMRLPNGRSFSEVLIPICPVGYCDLKIIKILTLRNANAIEAERFLGELKPGSMLYASRTITTNPSIMDMDLIMSELAKDRDAAAFWYFLDAFGESDLLTKVLSKEIGVSPGVGSVPNLDGTMPIFDLDRLAQDNILQPVIAYYK